MSLISGVSSLPIPKREGLEEPKESIRLWIDPNPSSPAVVVNNLATIEGPVDIYCWYEGSLCLPKLGAGFMRECIFEPLYKLKKDTKIYLYSLRAWSFTKSIVTMPSSTPLGEAINRINKAAIECIYSSAFFQYCTKISRESTLYRFISEELPKKTWLFALSESQKRKGTTIAELFNGQTSLFDCVKSLDVSAAYSLMQYVEGYYLIQESVRRGLLNGQKKIQVAFVLPNDESRYYVDYPKDIERMLKMDFGKDLSGVDINISFQFFEYGDSKASRPYIDKRSKAPKVEVEELSAYFSYLSSSSSSRRPPIIPRDIIHNLNGWY